MTNINLDMDCLRTFVTIIELGSFAEAAEAVGRTASAVSLQVNRLETQAGARLFHKVGRNRIPSPEGERLLETARKILDLNDRVVETLGHPQLTGEIKIGAIQDFADSVLPSILARFKLAHPQVRITARIERSKALAEAVDKGTLDLAIGVHGWSTRPHKKIRSDKMVWLGGSGFTLARTEPVPLVVFDPPCSFRNAAINALDKKKRDWFISFSSPSLSGLHAAVRAGLGVTVRTMTSFQSDLRPLSRSSQLPKLPTVGFTTYTKEKLSEPAVRLSQIIEEELQGL